MMDLYDIPGEWDREVYLAVCGIAEKYGGYCTLVRRANASARCDDWLKANKKWIESSSQTMRWPGTIVLDRADGVTLYKFQLSPSLVSELAKKSDSFFDWIGPEKPEDLSFLRSDGRPWFVSIAHEREAFFKLLPDEVTGELATLSLRLLGQDLEPDEVF